MAVSLLTAISLAFVAPLFTRMGGAPVARTPLPRMAATPLKVGEFGFPEPGPMPLVAERDACGVGFIVDRPHLHAQV